MIWPQRIFVADMAIPFGRVRGRGRVAAEAPVDAAVVAGDAGDVAAELLSREGVQGTSWKPRPSSIMAKRPEASVKRWR
jgi:hypothetical protein